jgi:hypothetical protein
MLRKNFIIFILMLLIAGCGSKNDELRNKLNKLIPDKASANVKKICERYIDDCVTAYDETKNAKRKITNPEEARAAEQIKSDFLNAHPDSYMLKTKEMVCEENQVTDKQEQQQLSNFVSQMMSAYFQLLN